MRATVSNRVLFYPHDRSAAAGNAIGRWTTAISEHQGLMRRALIMNRVIVAVDKIHFGVVKDRGQENASELAKLYGAF